MAEERDGLRDEGGQAEAVAIDAPPAQPPLYERESELHSARQAVDRLCQEFEQGGMEIGELLIYAGPAGIGKTSVLDAVRRMARSQKSCTVLFARGGERQRQQPFHVLRQLLLPTLSGLSAAERELVFGAWYGIVGPAIGLVPPSEEVEQRDPQAVRDGLDYVLNQLAARRAPLVLVVDDLHWADLESLTWLASFAVRARELPVLLVFAYRDEFREDAHGFQRQIESRATRTHELPRLNPSSVALLVHGELGDEAEDAFCRQVWAITAGIPYDTQALLRKVREQRLAPTEENSPQLRDLAAEARGMTRAHWLEKLGPTVLQFAWAAALLGTDIRPELAASISAQGHETAQESVRVLRKHQVLTTQPNGRLEFVHPLIGTSIYQSMTKATRTAMHGVAANAIENAGGSLLDASRHLVETDPEGDDRVVRKLRKAAAEHLAIGAPEAAQRCLQRALQEPPTEDTHAEVLYELGCSALLTDPAATVNQLRRALEPSAGLRPELRVDAVFRLAEVLAHSGDLVDAATVCREEADRTPPGPGRFRLEAISFMYAAYQRDEEDAPGRSRRLAELAATVDGQTTDAVQAVHVLRGWDLTLRGEPAAEAVRLTELAFENGRLPKALDWTNSTWNFELPATAGLAFTYTDELARAEKLFSEAVLSFGVAGWSGAHRGFASFLMGLVRFRRGLLADAEDFLRQGLKISVKIAPGIPLQWDIVGVLVDTLLARGRVEEAWELAQEYRFAPPYHPSAMVLPDAASLYGKLLLAKGERKEAAEVLREVGRQLEARGWHNIVWAPWLSYLALAVAPEDPVEADRLAALAVSRAEHFGTASAVGTALRLQAGLTEGQPAVELLERAVSRLSQSPAGYELAHALVDLGSELRRVRRVPEAAEYLYQGLELAHSCSADGLADRAREELANAGQHPNRLRTLSKDALSKPEWDVARLAARHVPPPRIAEQLGIDLSLVQRRLAAVHRKAGTGPQGLAAALGLPDSEAGQPD